MKILYCENSYGRDNSSAVVSLLTDSSVSRNHRPLFIPPHHEEWKMTLGVAVKVSRLGKFVAPRFASRYYDAITLVARLRPRGMTLPASATDVAFDSSIVVGDLIPIDTTTGLPSVLEIGGTATATIDTCPELIDRTLARMSGYFMIKHGDLIIPGDFDITVNPVLDTNINLTLNNIPCLSFKIK